jgi:nitrogen fixation NifU-like protein
VKPEPREAATRAVSGARGAAATSSGGSRGAGPYSDVIRERWRRPRFRGEVPNADLVAEDVNPLCGDRVRMTLAIEGDRVGTARFTGDSCAICTAAADVVAELATGRTRPEVATLRTEDVLAVLDADIRPTRMRCVSLPLSVVHRAMGGSG